MSFAILAPVNDCPVPGGRKGILAKLRNAIKIEIPIGYQDEAVFTWALNPLKTSATATGLVMALNIHLQRNKSRNGGIENFKVCGNKPLTYPVGIEAGTALKFLRVAREHIP